MASVLHPWDTAKGIFRGKTAMLTAYQIHIASIPMASVNVLGHPTSARSEQRHAYPAPCCANARLVGVQGLVKITLECGGPMSMYSPIEIVMVTASQIHSVRRQTA
mmetsp:Transcript_15959/g.29002  ORF Transcript_15959/g.29002 Transcript_15959/m.29002 type:complete len:106 (-) Transcript_15959:209-526(-)